jgi:hypothetical protein
MTEACLLLFIGQLSNTKPGLALKRIGSRFAGSRA